VDSAVQVSADWSSFASQVSDANPPLLDDSQLRESRQQLGQFLTRTPLPLGPGQWAGLSTSPLIVVAGAAASAKADGVTPELEVLYRDALTSNVALVAGSFPPASSLGSKLHVAVTEATAARFGLHPGSVLKLADYSARVPSTPPPWRPPTTCPPRRRAGPPTGRARCSPIRASSPPCRPSSCSSTCS
jgi:hypothetical protein